MGFSRTKILIFGLPMVSLAGCGNIALQLTAGNPNKIVGLTASEDGSAFSTKCGAKASELAAPGRVIADIMLESTPIVFKGEQAGIAFDIQLKATIHAVATAGQSTTDLSLKVVNVKADDNGRFSKPQAEKAAYENSQRRTSTGMSTGLLLNLQQTDPMFKGILCAVGFTSKIKMESPITTGVVTYYPGIPTAVNPMAAVSTFDSELGTTRSFTATAKIVQQAKEWAPVGTEAQITVTFNKISPDVKTIKGIPAGVTSIDADIAYEVLTTSSGADVSQFGLSKRQVFFVNTSSRQMVAVLDDSGRINPVDKKVMEPIMAILAN
jgi:hypothetical protein